MANLKDLTNTDNSKVLATVEYVEGVVADLTGDESSITIFHSGTTAPTNTKLLWIDTTAETGGLKYYNGSSWEHVPVAYT